MQTTRRALLAALTSGIVAPLARRRGATERAPSLPESSGPTFGDDVSFVRRYSDAVVLGEEPGGARVLVAPGLQGRVLTSSAVGEAGTSFGWINRALIGSRERQPHINAFGGEDRFWLGPEGGQFGLYFPPGAPFDFAHWQTPEPIDWGAWETVAVSRSEVRLRQPMALVNHSGTRFELMAGRVVRLLDGAEARGSLGGPLAERVAVVAFESESRITNVGTRAWEPATGLLSIWILGMFQPSPGAVVVAPYRPGPEAALGPVVNDSYFGKVPEDRLRRVEGALFFRADGRYRSKIGLTPQRSTGTLGSYAPEIRTLTLATFTLPDGPHEYVNSMWERQAEPLRGDAANSYNDGPPAPGQKPLGPFYELESSSPAAALAPGASLTHVHRTVHLVGADEDLDGVTRARLGVGLAAIRDAFGRG